MMRAPLHQKRGYYRGAIIVAIGLCAVVAGRTHEMGSLARMGSGFFPTAIGVLLVVVGFFIILASGLTSRANSSTLVTRVGTHPPGLPDGRGSLCLVAGVLAFLGFGACVGLVPATFALVFISAMGDRRNTVAHALVLALLMSVIAAIVFSWALRIQLPMFQWRF